jgi:hypothetical protein
VGGRVAAIHLATRECGSVVGAWSSGGSVLCVFSLGRVVHVCFAYWALLAVGHAKVTLAGDRLYLWGCDVGGVIDNTIVIVDHR